MQSFRFPGTTVNFSHAMVTPGRVEQVDNGLRFTAEAQPFVWVNPDLPAPGMDQAMQRPGTSQADGEPLSCEAPVVDSARLGIDYHQAFSEGYDHHASLHQEQSLRTDESRAPGASVPPYTTPASVISHHPPSAPVEGPIARNSQNPFGYSTVGHYGQGEHAFAGYIGDGTSALAGWYGDGTGLATTTSNAQNLGALSNASRPSDSRPVSSDYRLDQRFMHTNANAAMPSSTPYFSNQEYHPTIPNERWDPQLPHTSDGIVRHGVFAHPGDAGSSLRASYGFSSPAVPTSSASQVPYPARARYAIFEDQSPSSNSAGESAAQSGQSAFGVDGMEDDQQRYVRTSCSWKTSGLTLSFSVPGRICLSRLSRLQRNALRAA